MVELDVLFTSFSVIKRAIQKLDITLYQRYRIDRLAGLLLGWKKVNTTETKKIETDDRKLILNYTLNNETSDLSFSYSLYYFLKEHLPMKEKESNNIISERQVTI